MFCEKNLRCASFFLGWYDVIFVHEIMAFLQKKNDCDFGASCCIRLLLEQVRIFSDLPFIKQYF